MGWSLRAIPCFPSYKNQTVFRHKMLTTWQLSLKKSLWLKSKSSRSVDVFKQCSGSLFKLTAESGSLYESDALILYRSSRNGTSPEGTRDSGRTGGVLSGRNLNGPARPSAAGRGSRPSRSLPPLAGPTRSAVFEFSQTRTQTQRVFRDRVLIVHARPINRARHTA